MRISDWSSDVCSSDLASRITTITFDCHDPLALAEFWKAALGLTDDPDNPNSPDDPEALIIDPKGHHPALLFLPVPEGKTVKNRVHLDLMPDQPRDAEVERVLALGATLIADQRKPEAEEHTSELQSLMRNSY